jgi:Protein of unknown function (DUF2853)
LELPAAASSEPKANIAPRRAAPSGHDAHRAKFPFPKRVDPITVRPVNQQPTSQGRYKMGKRDELIAKYADDLKTKCKMTPDMGLLTKVTIGCGPSIYDNDASTVAASDKEELERIKNNFLIKKLGLKDGPSLMEGINAVIDTYGRSERNKLRAVFYYMLTKHFGKESVYK